MRSTWTGANTDDVVGGVVGVMCTCRVHAVLGGGTRRHRHHHNIRGAGRCLVPVEADFEAVFCGAPQVSTRWNDRQAIAEKNAAAGIHWGLSLCAIGLMLSRSIFLSQYAPAPPPPDPTVCGSIYTPLE
jgi:hypothetical protein